VVAGRPSPISQVHRDTAGARARVKEQRPALVTRLRWQWHLRNGPYAAAGVVVAVSWTTAIKNTGATGQYHSVTHRAAYSSLWRPTFASCGLLSNITSVPNSFHSIEGFCTTAAFCITPHLTCQTVLSARSQWYQRLLLPSSGEECVTEYIQNVLQSVQVYKYKLNNKCNKNMLRLDRLHVVYDARGSSL